MAGMIIFTYASIDFCCEIDDMYIDSKIENRKVEMPSTCLELKYGI